MCVVFVPVNSSKYPAGKRVTVRSTVAVFAGLSGCVKEVSDARVLLVLDNAPNGQKREQWFLPIDLD